MCCFLFSGGRPSKWKVWFDLLVASLGGPGSRVWLLEHVRPNLANPGSPSELASRFKLCLKVALLTEVVLSGNWAAGEGEQNLPI